MESRTSILTQPSQVRLIWQALREGWARRGLMVFAGAYLLNGLGLLPALFALVGSLDPQHELWLAFDGQKVTLTLMHERGERARAERMPCHCHHWPARMLAGNGGPGHPDHEMSFATPEGGVREVKAYGLKAATESAGVPVICDATIQFPATRNSADGLRWAVCTRGSPPPGHGALLSVILQI